MRPVKYSKSIPGVFTGTGEPVCRNVAGVYYILDVSLPAHPTGRESLPDRGEGRERQIESNEGYGWSKTKKNPVSSFYFNRSSSFLPNFPFNPSISFLDYNASFKFLFTQVE